MMQRKHSMPRILLAAQGSGSGKTTMTCALVGALKRKGKKPACLKCGPDYIDPMFHRKVLGVSSGNLDTFFTDEETTRYLLARKAEGADITVLEGVMGYYDGLGGVSDRASSYEIARVTRTPVILVVDGKGASVSLAAQIKGMLSFREDGRICGILLNRVREGYYGRLKELLEKECGLPVLGFLPPLPELELPSRHLGLVMPEELERFEAWADAAAGAALAHVDIEKICRIAADAEWLSAKEPALPRLPRQVRLAVARDEAFSFYYEENLELLERMGAQLVFFSPLHDACLPQDVDGLLLGGGYPENYAEDLAEAVGMRRSIRQACEGGMPCLAECGGFLYLQKEMRGEKGEETSALPMTVPMAGVLSGSGYPAGKLCRFGYIEARSRYGGVFGDAGGVLRGHEFHHWDCTENGAGFLASKPVPGKGMAKGNKAYPCMVYTGTMAAGFPHFYYYSNPGMIRSFLDACLSFRAGREAGKRWDLLAKPIDSLGLLEKHVKKLCRIAGSAESFSIKPRALVIFCADHGVVKEGVTQTGSQVTRIVSENFAAGRSTVNILAEMAQADVFTVDVGMDAPPFSQKTLITGAVVDRKIARGSGDIAVEPAMTRAQCEQAIETGMRIAGELKERGYRILATGEMGIGNTTPTSVLASLLLELPAGTVTGRGAGLSEEAYQHKCQVVERAIERVKAKGIREPVELLAEAGGYEIAAMTGLFLGGARFRIPVLIDGAISAAAAVLAARMDARVPDCCIASHCSREKACVLLLEQIGCPAILHADMCLGEGSGAVALLPLLDMAMEVYARMGTFTEYEIAPYARYEDGK